MCGVGLRAVCVSSVGRGEGYSLFGIKSTMKSLFSEHSLSVHVCVSMCVCMRACFGLQWKLKIWSMNMRFFVVVVAVSLFKGVHPEMGDFHFCPYQLRYLRYNLSASC